MLRCVLLISCTLAGGIVASHATGCARGTPAAEPVKADPSSAPPPTIQHAETPAVTPSTPSQSASVEPVVDATPPAKPGKPLSATECNKLWDHAQDADASAYAAAAKTCSADADCEAVHVRACLADCASGGIAKSASAAYAGVRATVQATDCKKWFDGNCAMKTPMPVPSCPMRVPICTSGNCATKIGP